MPRISALNAWVLQTRESAELRAQTEQMGKSLLEWLKNHTTATPAQIAVLAAQEPTYPVAFALAASSTGAPLRECLLGVGVGLVVFGLWINLAAPWMQLGQPTATFTPLDAQGQPIWPLIIVRWVGAALIVPALALLVGFQPEALALRFGGWTAAHGGASGMGLAVYIGAQALIFAAVMLVCGTPLGRMLTPSFLRRAWVHRAAVTQFEALGLTRTRDATGVLLYVNLAHHRAEVLADSGIYAKAPTQVWDEVVALLLDGVRRGDAADGFVRAATRTGEILSAYLPPRDDDANELSDSVFLTR